MCNVIMEVKTYKLSAKTALQNSLRTFNKLQPKIITFYWFCKKWILTDIDFD